MKEAMSSRENAYLSYKEAVKALEQMVAQRRDQVKYVKRHDLGNLHACSETRSYRDGMCRLFGMVLQQAAHIS